MKRVLCAGVALSVVLLCISLMGRGRAEGYAVGPDAAQRAREAGVLYAKNCAGCHGRDGRAKTLKAKFNHARDLTNAEWQANTEDERIFNSIANGRGKMPAYGKKFSDAEIDALVGYVRQLKR